MCVFFFLVHFIIFVVVVFFIIFYYQLKTKVKRAKVQNENDQNIERRQENKKKEKTLVSKIVVACHQLSDSEKNCSLPKSKRAAAFCFVCFFLSSSHWQCFVDFVIFDFVFFFFETIFFWDNKTANKLRNDQRYCAANN